MHSTGKRFRQLLRDEPYLFTAAVYPALDAQIGARAVLQGAGDQVCP